MSIESPLDVLIVDDSKAIRKILQLVLRRTGLPINTVHEAGDGDEALRILETARPRPSIILSNINMPKMDGLELLRHVRKNPELRQVAVVLMGSGEDSEATVRTVGTLGANGYIRKPFTSDHIKEVMMSVSEKSPMTPIPENKPSSLVAPHHS